MGKELAKRPMPWPVTADWLNWALHLFWPVLSISVEQMVKGVVLPLLRAQMKALEPLNIDPCELGSTPPDLSEVEVLNNPISEGWMDLRLHVRWHADANVNLSCRLGSLTLPEVLFSLPIFVSFYGLIPRPPFFEGFTMYMANGFLPAKDIAHISQGQHDPYMGLNVKGTLQGFNTDFIEDIILHELNKTVCKALVLPRRTSILLATEKDMIFDIIRPRPRGLLRVTVMSASGLVGTEWKMASLLTGERCNDPYVTVMFGGSSTRKMRTPTVYNTLNPSWEEQNSIFFIVDIPSLQHLNIRVWDDGLTQQLRESMVGVASDVDEIARKLGISISDALGMPSDAPLDKELETERALPLDSWWDGRDSDGGIDAKEFQAAKAEVLMGFHWRPIVEGQPAMAGQLVSQIRDDDDEEEDWPTCILRVGIGNLELRNFAGESTESFYVKCTVTPVVQADGSILVEEEEEVSVKQTARAKASLLSLKAMATEDPDVVIRRMVNSTRGVMDKDVVFDTSFDFMIRNPLRTKVTLQIFSEQDYDHELFELRGELTKEVSSLLSEAGMVKQFHHEELEHWKGNLPPQLSGELRLWPVCTTTPPKISKRLLASEEEHKMASVRERDVKQARQLQLQAAQLRAQAENLERQAREKDCEISRQKEGAKETFLKVEVIAARGLRATDWGILQQSSSDPYCVCEMKGHRSNGFRTKTIKKMLDPIWDHEGRVRNYKAGNSLVFTVYDEDFGKSDDILGRYELPASEFVHKGFAGELRLKDTGGTESYLEVKVSDLYGNFPPEDAHADGEISKLKVHIIGARSLKAADVYLTRENSSDPYCVFEVPGRPRATFRTHTIEKTLYPEWRYESKIRGWKPGDALKFQVFDEDWGKSDDFLGRAELKSEQFYPNGFAGELKLLDAGDAEAFLDVQITDENGQYPAEQTNMKLKILSARGLPASDHGLISASSDPYCVVEIEGRLVAHKPRTQTIQKTLNPKWNFVHSVPDYKVGDTLKFTVWDEDWISADDILGHAVLSAEQFHPDGFAGEVKLQCPDYPDSDAYLKIEICNSQGCFREMQDEEEEDQAPPSPSTAYEKAMGQVEKLRQTSREFKASGKQFIGSFFGSPDTS
eukprot:TRINITY_DN20872_c0_g2_i1.p1 TRINITY_DN20872_c0_g2~~TRINITY_DN20872_c0_g2_i1.p1  ORF type:complete len:1300 (-),score=256.53 TRINITY_DN20872_c0_g2_i1:56-3394(-)